MTTSRGTIEEEQLFSLANTSPVGGADTTGDGAPISENWSEGVLARQFNRAGVRTYVIPGGSTQLIDLQTDLGVDGAALALDECRFLRLQSDDANPSAGVTVEPDATDGWTNWIPAATVLPIAAGETASFTHPLAGGKVVEAANKQLLITNLDGSDAATIRFVVAGVDLP